MSLNLQPKPREDISFSLEHAQPALSYVDGGRKRKRREAAVLGPRREAEV